MKKNIAPPKKEESKAGAFDVIANNEGEVIFEQPIKKESSLRSESWSKPNEFKQNKMLETEVESLGINKLFEEAKPLNIKNVVRGLDEQELKEGMKEAKNIQLEQNISKKYNDYVSVYKQFYNDDNYERKLKNEKGDMILAATWAKKEAALVNRIKRYKTHKNQLETEEKDKLIGKINKKYEGPPTYEV